MAVSAKEMPKNYTDKKRFAAASSCIETGILTLLGTFRSDYDYEYEYEFWSRVKSS